MPDYCTPIRTGTDIAFLGGVINYLLTTGKIQHEYVLNYTDFSFIVREDFANCRIVSQLDALRAGRA